jgi:hypothetical protein
MSSETIVAVFDTSAQAASAISALEADGIPSSSIKHSPLWRRAFGIAWWWPAA